jgi:hypothetical protein
MKSALRWFHYTDLVLDYGIMMKWVLMEQPIRNCAGFSWLCFSTPRLFRMEGEMQKPCLCWSDVNKVFDLMTLSAVETAYSRRLCECNVALEQWWKCIDWRIVQCSERNLTQCQFLLQIQQATDCNRTTAFAVRGEPHLPESWHVARTRMPSSIPQ